MSNSIIIDRRLNPKGKSLGNRQRFLRKINSATKKAIRDAIGTRSIDKVVNEENITIPAGDISEPTFSHKPGSGRHSRILPGNEDFVVGDALNKPRDGQGNGNGPGGASKDGMSEDEFAFVLSKDEFLDVLFEDLELPDLVKKDIKQTFSIKNIRSGFTNTGSPANLDTERSFRASLGRRIALRRPTDEEVEALENQINELTASDPEDPKLEELKEELELMLRKRKQVPYFDDVDMRYRLYRPDPEPTTAAVMFCILDVSGSMDETKKDWSKRFFMLLYLFLQKQYKKVEIVFIRHHMAAKEVSEEEFFTSKESGGTLVSTALNLTQRIIDERYSPDEWNIYVGQCSDGDNFDSDNPKVIEDMHKMLPLVQYFAYVQITPNMTYAQDLFGQIVYENTLWQVYKKIAEIHKNLQCKCITQQSEIWTVFRQLFEKRQK